MVYAGRLGEREVHLGVSGRLMDDNLVMWDEETNSLWSQILGEALYGPSKGQVLDMLPAVFVGLGTWTRMHPDSLVLDLPTVRQQGWYFTTDDLARGAAGRTPTALGIGLRRGGETVAVGMQRLHRDGAVPLEVGGVPLVVVWHAGEKAALVYRRDPGGRALDLRMQDDHLGDGEHRWHSLTGAAATDTAPLTRFPYIPTYLDAWRRYYPDGRVIE